MKKKTTPAKMPVKRVTPSGITYDYSYKNIMANPNSRKHILDLACAERSRKRRK